MKPKSRLIEVVWRRYYRRIGSWLVRYTDGRGRHSIPVGGAWSDDHMEQARNFARELAELQQLKVRIYDKDNHLVETKDFT